MTTRRMVVSEIEYWQVRNISQECPLRFLSRMRGSSLSMDANNCQQKSMAKPQQSTLISRTIQDAVSSAW